MRIRNSATMTRSSTSSNGHHPQLLARTTITEGYDFNRNRSTESTENTLSGKSSSDAQASSSSSSFVPISSCTSFEDRGVPISPKKLPQTPPRDHGSPYRPGTSDMGHEEEEPLGNYGRWGVLLPPSTVKQPFLCDREDSLTSGCGVPSRMPFLRPSSWRQKEEDHGSSIYRSSPIMLSNESVSMSRENDSHYTIQRSFAFDDDNNSDSEL